MDAARFSLLDARKVETGQLVVTPLPPLGVKSSASSSELLRAPRHADRRTSDACLSLFASLFSIDLLTTRDKRSHRSTLDSTRLNFTSSTPYQATAKQTNQPTMPPRTRSVAAAAARGSSSFLGLPEWVSEQLSKQSIYLVLRRDGAGYQPNTHALLLR